MAQARPNSRRIAALALGVGSLLWATTAAANTSWQLVFSDVNTGNGVMSISAINPTTAWAVGVSKQGTSSAPAAWRTTDGVTWLPIAQPPSGGLMTIPMLVAFLDENTGWMAGVSASLAGQSNIMWRTTTGGMSWDELYQAPDEIKHIQVTSDWGMFGVGGATVFRTFDGINFDEAQPAKPSDMDLVGLHMFSKDCGYAIAATPEEGGAMGSAVLWTSDGGTTWTTRSESREFRLRRAWFVSADLGWAVGNRGSEGLLAKTTDGGKTWTTSTAPDHPPVLGKALPVTSCEEVRFFDDRRGVALCLCCTGNCEPDAEDSPTFATSFLRTADGGQSWAMDPDYEPQMAAPPFPEMSKMSGMLTMAFTGPNAGFLAGQNNLILRYTADNPEPEGWPPAECSGSGAGGTGSGSGGSGSGSGSGGSGNAGSSGSGAGASSADGDSDSGCGCRVESNPNTPATAAWLLLLGAFGIARRRRLRR